jgi:hypothetical protein
MLICPVACAVLYGLQAAAVAQGQKTTISLKGSTSIVTEFFGYSINSILFQRGLYPADNFAPVKKYASNDS